MKVRYDDHEYELKYSFRALMIFENITNKSFNPTTLSDIIIFFYSVLLSSAKPAVIEFDRFVELLDREPELLQQFSEWIAGVFTQQRTLTPEASEVKMDEEKAEEESKKK